MGLETGSYIVDLTVANPAVNDPKSQGDDHIRLVKTAIKNSFPGFSGPICVGGTDTGVTNSYVLSAPLPAYVENTIVVWKPVNSNTGAATININSLGSRSIKQVDGTALTANDLISGRYVGMIDNGTEYRLLSVSKNYVDQLAFSAVLPDQTDNAGKMLITDGATATWGASLQALALSTALPISSGGTGVTFIPEFKIAHNIASSGENFDITSLNTLTTPLPYWQGGTSGNTPATARAGIGAAASGANADITALTGLTTPIPMSLGGTGGTTPGTARSSIGAQAELGFNPVQQGTGTGQLGNAVKIGYKGSNLTGLTIDVTDFGNLITSTHIASVKFKVRFTFDAIILGTAYNVSSVSNTSVGDWTINFTTALTETNYVVSAVALNGTAILCTTIDQQTTFVKIRCFDAAGTEANPVSLTVFGV